MLRTAWYRIRYAWPGIFSMSAFGRTDAIWTRSHVKSFVDGAHHTLRDERSVFIPDRKASKLAISIIRKNAAA